MPGIDNILTFFGSSAPSDEPESLGFGVNDIPPTDTMSSALLMDVELTEAQQQAVDTLTASLIAKGVNPDSAYSAALEFVLNGGGFANAPELFPPDFLTIMEFYNLRLVSIRLQHILNKTDVDDPRARRSMWAECLAWATTLGALKNTFLEFSKLENALYQKQQLQIAQFNNGPLAAYNQALDDAATPGQIQSAYDDYIAAVDAFNQLVQANNQTIASLNNNRIAIGIEDLIPDQEEISPVDMPSLPNPAHAPRVSTLGSLSTTITIEPLNEDEENFFNSLENDFDSFNSQFVRPYNSIIAATAAETEAFEDAYNAYLNSPTPANLAAYNAAVAAYNSYASGLNSSELSSAAAAYRNAIIAHNNNVDSYNNQIAELNAQRSLSDPVIPSQVKILPVPSLDSLLLPHDIPTAPPFPDVNPVPNPAHAILPLIPLGSSTPTSSADYFTRFYSPSFLDKFSDLTNYVETLQTAEAHVANIKFKQGISNLLPNNAFIPSVPETSTGKKSAAGTATGGGSVGLVLGLRESSLQGVMSNGILQALRIATSIAKPLPEEISNKIGILALDVLLTSGLLSVSPALQSLVETGKTDSDNAAGASLLLANLKTVGSLVSSGALVEKIQALLEENGVSPAEIAQIQEAVLAGLSSGLLQVALLQTAVGLGLPGLLQQVFGTLENGQDVQLLAGSTTGTRLNDILRSQLSIQALKQTLVKFLLGKLIEASDRQQALAEAGAQNGAQSAQSASQSDQSSYVPDPEAAQIANDILESSIIRSSIQGQALMNSILSNERERSQQQALSIINDAVDSALIKSATLQARNIHDDIFHNNLSANLKKAGFSESAANVLADQARAFTNDEQLLQKDLDSSYVKDSILKESQVDRLFQNQDLQKALAVTADIKSYETKRQFRDDLAQALQNLKIEKNRADDLANQVILATQSSRLKNAFNSENVDQDLLKTSLLKQLEKENEPSIAYEPLISSALNRVFNQNFSNGFVFRSSLENALQEVGISSSIASQLVANSSISSTGVNALRTLGSNQVLNDESLRDQLHTEIVKTLKTDLKVTNASKLADEIAVAVLNSRDLLNDQIKVLKDRSNDRTLEALTINFKTFINPPTDGFHLSLHLMDQANTFLRSLTQLPSNYKKFIDTPELQA